MNDNIWFIIFCVLLCSDIGLSLVVLFLTAWRGSRRIVDEFEDFDGAIIEVFYGDRRNML